MFYKKNVNGEALDSLATVFEQALGESPLHARKLAKDWFLYRRVSGNNWSQAANSPLVKTIERADLIVMQDQNIVQNFLNYHREGIILLTIHMGDYLHSILKLLKLARRRRVVILRKKIWTQSEQLAFSKLSLIGHDVEVIRHGPSAPRSITRALRKGAIAILLYDLPKRWGKTASVEIFNHQLHWVIGPLQLAILGKASVVPFFSFNTKYGSVCELKPVRDYRQIDEDRSLLLESEMQYMAYIAETYIKKNVVQWDNWHLIGEMCSGEINDDAAQ